MRLFTVLWNMAEIASEKQVLSAAGALAYFLILSVFPMLICLHAFIGLLDLDLTALLEPISVVLPQAGEALLIEYARYLSENQSPGLFWAGLFGVVFSASAAFRQLLAVMDRLYGHKGGGFGRIVASVAFSLLMLVTVYLSVFILFTGGWFLQWLASTFRLASLPWNWMWIRFFLLFSFLLLFVLIVYRLAALPGRRRAVEESPAPPLFPGAFFAAFALVAASMVFSWFLERSSRYSLVYGSLASVIILLVWLYLCGCIVLLGGVLNCALFRCRAHRES